MRRLSAPYWPTNWGVPWQIYPRVHMQIMNGADRGAAKRAMQAMMEMVKFDVAKIEAAARG